MITVMELQLIFFLLSFLHGIYGQITIPPSTDVARGKDVSLVCTSTEDDPIFTWNYVTEAQPLYVGTTRATSVPRYDNIVLQEGTDAKMSILNISAIDFEEEGEYLCSTTATTTPPPNTVVTVEDASTSKEIELININNFANYQATCDAIGSKPEETITWVLDGVTQTVGIVETDPDISADHLFDKRSVFTFPSSLNNYNVTLVCEIGGHQVSSLDRQESRRVDVQNPPHSKGIMIGFNSDGTDLTVSCNTDDSVAEAIPPMGIFYIYMYPNRTLIAGPTSDNTVTIREPEQGTVFTCEGSNYLGNTTTTQNYPGRTTAPPPTTEPITTEGNTTSLQAPEGTTSGDTVGSGGTGTEPEGLSAGAVAGIVIGVIACIVIIIVVILYLVKPECCPCFATAGLKSSGSGKKPAGSAVGSSNGSEKDKINQPVAAQRSQAPIQHTASNPGQELYALPERKQPAGGRGGDAPDRGSGPGQNEPQDIFYAALDLSSKAGHTEKHIPKNENDVVVYSSILV